MFFRVAGQTKLLAIKNADNIRNHYYQNNFNPLIIDSKSNNMLIN